jgi:hypothetical protein
MAIQSSPLAHAPIAPPGPPSAAAAGAALGGAAAPAAPGAAPAAAAGATPWPAEYDCWCERSGSPTSRVRQAEPGSRVTVTVVAVGKVPVAVYYELQPSSEQRKQPEFARRRRLSYARYVQPSKEQRSV